ncbi:hypothetical protein, partial [Aquiflexum sp.]|uniref:hypothetical protein n=1 Tax=Aquiflexum sp. TaxID=1872584 RepID=UPI00359396BB
MQPRLTRNTRPKTVSRLFFQALPSNSPQYPECVPKQERDSGNPTFPNHQSDGTKEVYETKYGIPDISPSQVIKPRYHGGYEVYDTQNGLPSI